MPANVTKKELQLRLNSKTMSAEYDSPQTKNITDDFSISIDLSDNDFSFKNIVNDEPLLNPNISDDQITKNKNSNLKIDDKFDNISDPIYNLDENVSLVNSKTKSNKKQNIISNKLKKITRKPLSRQYKK
tara:strand:- start:3078 stop:3467 length:390 start_codon:yes stop_codon:yes gene_type:complete